MTIREVLINIRERLQNAGIEDFEYESWAFLDWKLHIDRAEFYMNPNGEVKEELLAELESVLKQREQRVPLQYLMGECEFMGYDFYVDERVLIPRQDTECLVELAVEDIRNIKTQNRCESNNTADQKNEQKVKVLDLCTGSGCIGISIAHYKKNTDVELFDISDIALETAEKNIKRNNVSDRVKSYKMDILNEYPKKKYDVVVSNPPYIEKAVIETLQTEVKDYEPRIALDGGEDGLVFYRRITETAHNFLKKGGLLAFEIAIIKANL